jgi:hypothetical protein
MEQHIMKNGFAALVFFVLNCVVTTSAIPGVAANGLVATYTPPVSSGVRIDYANAKPMPMPIADIPPMSQSALSRTTPDPAMLYGNPKMLPGSVGSGKEDPLQLAPPKQLEQQDGRRPEFGTASLPFTTSRVNAEGDFTAQYFPFREAGKLFITHGFNMSTCSASMIQRGLAVTAAHCVVEHGTREFFSTAEYVPAYNNGTAPYGRWEVASARVLNAWIDGKDHCARKNVCDDDFAILTLRPRHDGSFAGDSTGWFGVGYDGYGFTASGHALINQLGYPGALDDGKLMERNDAQGSIDAASSFNTIIGSLMTQGASGGPWVVNLGVTPTPSPFLRFGTDNAPSVVGVSSWKSRGDEIKQNGASPFRSGDSITALIVGACHATPAAC